MSVIQNNKNTLYVKTITKFFILILCLFYYTIIYSLSFAGPAKDYMNDDNNLLTVNNSLYGYHDNNKKRKNKGFIGTYIFPEENQIFGKKKHLISLFGGYDYAKFAPSTRWLTTKTYAELSLYDQASLSQIRKNVQIALSYSRPNRFWEINGRFSIGLFTWLMKQNIDMKFDDSYTLLDDKCVQGWMNNYTIGFEAIQEAIIGHKNLYLTLGFGVSYQMVVGSSVNTDNDFYQWVWQQYRKPKILWNNSNFNWVIKASIGHRFDCGLIIEANWKHYSNGNLGNYNWGLNFWGGTIGFVF